MASIARSLRLARLSAVSATIRAPAYRAVFIRPFSVTASNAIRKYTKEHEWIDISADKKTGVVGISEYAAKTLGDIVYVELPEEGLEVQAGDAIGAVESVKSAADIYSPVACKITQVNLLLEEKPGTVNQVPEDDSHGGGWIAKVQLTEQGLKDFEALMDADAYAEFTAAESDH
ncbi:putative mitochondrial glycine cleavage system H protein [Thermochaetoides thermophila DSM 1495]|uniref:Glycine cleavage system H protein n=1 Tax=Chaetomium thermophilum (strain DSM 1495 / CBS 144.50 / IMI 039719) TaxID=759272 RepID=G0S787_CHATD|nr:putative mitochondrial glycine cleavage system H protein [Thermochaetoides thermophila DSM 1495]EGS20942.1 putative mitochondrial glycine cleavage system H protein [Thermochaetoides thermophila DSM 1495]